MAEKKANLLAEETSAAASINIIDAELQGWDETATKRLLWRLDWHIIPFMSLIYLYSHPPFSPPPLFSIQISLTS